VSNRPWSNWLLRLLCCPPLLDEEAWVLSELRRAKVGPVCGGLLLWWHKQTSQNAHRMSGEWEWLELMITRVESPCAIRSLHTYSNGRP